ncbi:MAG: SprT-like domain-containing protein [Pseudomonadota bacterium]
MHNRNLPALLPSNPFNKKIQSYVSNDQADAQREPTPETYDQLNRAAAFFNEHLFGGILPPTLITLQRVGGAYGYFSGSRFRHAKSHELTDEIALNPQFIPWTTIFDTCSTLVHEQVHQWQFHFSKHPERIGKMRRYHDKEWSNKMIEVGLMPSSTGQPGGHKTGRSMSHYIIGDGPFQRAAKKLVDEGFCITWQDRTHEQLMEALKGADPKTLGLDGIKKRLKKTAAKKDRSKVKFTCSVCGQNAWAKATARLACSQPDCNKREMTSAQ